MMQQAYFREYALQMAHTQADYLVKNTAQVAANTVVPQAVQLIVDCVHHLHLPVLAVEVALRLHPVVERWAAWMAWAEALDALLTLPEDAYEVPDRIRLLHNRNHAACELGDHAAAAHVAETALRLAEAQADHTLIALSLHEVALIAYHCDNLALADMYWKHAYDLGASLFPPLKLGHICMNMGLVAVAQGAFDAAHQDFNKAFTYYQVQNDPISLARLQCNIADLQRRQGQFAEAVATLLAARATLDKSGAWYEHAMAGNGLGCVYLEMQQFHLAATVFEATIQTFDKIGSLSGKALVLSNLAELYVTTEQWQQARTTLQEARELATLCQKSLLVAAVDVDQGRMLAAHGEYAAAQHIWQGALAIQKEHGALQTAEQTWQLLASLSNI